VGSGIRSATQTITIIARAVTQASLAAELSATGRPRSITSGRVPGAGATRTLSRL
jgi:hypothetical protein